MRVGVVLPTADSDGPGRAPSWPEIREFAQHAESAGLDSLWVADHLYSNERGRPPSGIHEAWSLLAAVAASTSRVELGHLVTCVSFRSPGLVAKMAATLDQVSGGRLVLGLGCGWNDQEYLAFGYPTDHRVSRFAEALEIIVRLLRGETVTYSGRFHSVAGAVVLPPPARRIPILVAARGPRMLGLTARHADAWNEAWFKEPDSRLASRLRDLNAALDAAGRERDSMRVTIGVELQQAGAPAAAERLARWLDQYSKRGVDDVIMVLEPAATASLDRVAEALRLARTH